MFSAGAGAANGGKENTGGGRENTVVGGGEQGAGGGGVNPNVTNGPRNGLNIGMKVG